jgi:H+/Cl- antiporter ClcA
MTVKKKIVAVFALIITVWILTPIPEGAIIFGLVTGATANQFLPLPYTIILSIVGAVFGALLFRKLHVLEKLRTILRGT